MLLKLDLSKAYDKLSWKGKDAEGFWFLGLLGKMGCEYLLLSSTFFSILINGTPSPTFKASRGTRQGDPLSSFLFILIEEGLGRLTRKGWKINLFVD